MCNEVSKRWRRVAAGLGLLILTAAALADSKSVPTFATANEHYEKRNYREAIRAYESLLTNNAVSPALLFNLGNAYFKNGQRGYALVQYRRAERLSPRDPDIQANLRFTRDSVQGNSSVASGTLNRLLSYFTLNEITVTAALLFWTLVGMLCWVRYKPMSRTPLRPLIVGNSILLAAVGAFLLAARFERSKEIAIVTAPEAIVRFGPLEESQTAFTAPDGTELRVLAKRDDWVQVSDRAGRSGWLSAKQAVVFTGLPKK